MSCQWTHRQLQPVNLFTLCHHVTYLTIRLWPTPWNRFPVQTVLPLIQVSVWKNYKKKNLEIICFKLVLFIKFIETLKNNPTHLTQLIIWYVLILLIIQTFSKSYWCSLIFTFDFLWRHVKAVDRWGPCVPYLMRPTPRYTCTSPSQTDSSRSKPYSASIFSVRVNLWAIKVFLIDKTKYLKADFSCTCMSV